MTEVPVDIHRAIGPAMPARGSGAARRRPDAAILLFILAAPLIACDPPTTHVLIGYPYQSASNCLSVSASVDVVDGPAPATTCAPVCILDPLGNYFVTSMCAPYPPLDTVETSDGGLDPTCTMAIAAYAANLVCGADAGIAGDAAPDAPLDAPPDAPETSTDASTE